MSIDILDSYLHKLINLQQLSTVESYEQHFKMLHKLVVDTYWYIEESYFVDCCVQGFIQEIKQFVQFFSPSTLEACFTIAKMKETMLTIAAASNKVNPSSCPTQYSYEVSVDEDRCYLEEPKGSTTIVLGNTIAADESVVIATEAMVMEDDESAIPNEAVEVSIEDDGCNSEESNDDSTATIVETDSVLTILHEVLVATYDRSISAKTNEVYMVYERVMAEKIESTKEVPLEDLPSVDSMVDYDNPISVIVPRDSLNCCSPLYDGYMMLRVICTRCFDPGITLQNASCVVSPVTVLVWFNRVVLISPLYGFSNMIMGLLDELRQLQNYEWFTDVMKFLNIRNNVEQSRRYDFIYSQFPVWYAMEKENIGSDNVAICMDSALDVTIWDICCYKVSIDSKGACVMLFSFPALQGSMKPEVLIILHQETRFLPELALVFHAYKLFAAMLTMYTKVYIRDTLFGEELYIFRVKWSYDKPFQEHCKQSILLAIREGWGSVHEFFSQSSSICKEACLVFLLSTIVLLEEGLLRIQLLVGEASTSQKFLGCDGLLFTGVLAFKGGISKTSTSQIISKFIRVLITEFAVEGNFINLEQGQIYLFSDIALLTVGGYISAVLSIDGNTVTAMSMRCFDPGIHLYVLLANKRISLHGGLYLEPYKCWGDLQPNIVYGYFLEWIPSLDNDWYVLSWTDKVPDHYTFFQVLFVILPSVCDSYQQGIFCYNPGIQWVRKDYHSGNQCVGQLVMTTVGHRTLHLPNQHAALVQELLIFSSIRVAEFQLLFFCSLCHMWDISIDERTSNERPVPKLLNSKDTTCGGMMIISADPQCLKVEVRIWVETVHAYVVDKFIDQSGWHKLDGCREVCVGCIVYGEVDTSHCCVTGSTIAVDCNDVFVDPHNYSAGYVHNQIVITILTKRSDLLARQYTQQQVLEAGQFYGHISFEILLGNKVKWYRVEYKNCSMKKTSTKFTSLRHHVGDSTLLDWVWRLAWIMMILTPAVCQFLWELGPCTHPMVQSFALLRHIGKQVLGFSCGFLVRVASQESQCRLLHDAIIFLDGLHSISRELGHLYLQRIGHLLYVATCGVVPAHAARLIQVETRPTPYNHKLPLLIRRGEYISLTMGLCFNHVATAQVCRLGCAFISSSGDSPFMIWAWRLLIGILGTLVSLLGILLGIFSVNYKAPKNLSLDP